MLEADLPYGTVSELGGMLQSRDISPVELTRGCLRRIARFDPTLRSFVTVMEESALREARAAEKDLGSGRRRGPLHGIPYAAKDLLAARGAPTTWGARPLADQVFDDDAAVVSRLREAGAILVGKLAMIELAGGLGYSKGDASLTGAARNPWDRSRWTCGSSSGAAVAAGLVPFAIGSETWGSIICPASFCGVSGLRPTFGRVSRRGAMALSWSLDKIGPMARSAADCEMVLRAISGHDPDDPFTVDEKPPPRSDPARVRGMRVGYLELDFEAFGDRSVERAFKKALADLEGAGVKADEVKLPDLPFEPATVVILVSEVATALEELERSGAVRKLVSPAAPLSFIASRAVRGADLVKAQRVRTVCQRAMADFFARWDVLLYPGEMRTAFPIDLDFSELPWSDPAGAAGNLCGLPAISVPCGFGDDGLPVSLTAMSGAFGEHRAVALARRYQEVTSWHRRRPDLTPAA